VRVERAAPAPGWADAAACAGFLHAGKRRVRTESAELIAELAGAADIVVAEAGSADALEALGFDGWRAPVKVAITPFGRTGPKRNWRASPHVLLAMGGFTYLMGDPDRPPLSMPGHFVEYQAGQYAYVAANACRFAGAGDAVDVSMLEAVMASSQFTTVQWHCQGRIRSRHGNDYWWVVPTTLFALRDGWAYVNVIPGFWDTFTLFLERPELAADERFTTNALRMRNREALHAIVAEVMAGMTRAAAQRRAAEVRLALGVVQTFEEVLADPHLAARGFWETLVLPDGREVRAPGAAHRCDGKARPTLALTPPEDARG